MMKGILQDTWWLSTEQLLLYSSTMCLCIMLFIGSLQKSFLRLAVTIWEQFNLTNAFFALSLPP